MSEQVRALQNQIGTRASGIVGILTMQAFMAHYGFTKEQTAHFFGQCHHETGGFRFFIENLNYTAEALRRIWPRHFPDDATARAYARHPERIANRAYANRMGNGNESSGDGWRFRGRGAIQLTGRNNYTRYRAEAVANPDNVATIWAFDSAVWFFRTTPGLMQAALQMNDNAILQVTRRINGGTIGLADRTRQTLNFYRQL